VSARLVRALVVVAAALALFGCERLRDVKRCRTLARGVNGSLDTIESATAKPTSSAYGRATLEYEGLAKRLDTFDGGSPELERDVHEYAAFARSSARASAGLAQALQMNNSAAAQVNARELERLSRQEKVIVRRIDDDCQPR
jgi:hypothetical protein